MAVIDEKLTRMKELAEQSATGSYTTAQRDIINSEYQAMANEIDRIANATNFNGVKLLDGSLAKEHGGLGLKVHFGVGNNAAEDYYFINTGDVRATAATGLRVGGDAKNDIWAQGGAAQVMGGATGCCAGGFDSLTGAAGFADGQAFSYGYNWDWKAQNNAAYDNGEPNLLTGKYLAGRYTVTSAESLQDLVNKVNAGVQSRVGISLNPGGAAAITNGGAMAVCVGDEAYYWGDETAAAGYAYDVAQFIYNFDTGIFKGGDILASASLAFLLKNATGLSVQGIVDGARDDDEAVRQINAAVAALKGKILFATSGVANRSAGITSVTMKMASAYIKISTLAQNAAAGISDSSIRKLFKVSASAAMVANFTTSSLVSAANYKPGTDQPQFGTGVFTDGAGLWTTSATAAGKLGWTEITASLNASMTASQAVTAVNNALRGAGVQGGTAKSATTQVTVVSAAALSALGIYASGNQWTDNKAIASAMGWGAGTHVVNTGGTINVNLQDGDGFNSIKDKLQAVLGGYTTKITNVAGDPTGLQGVKNSAGQQIFTNGTATNGGRYWTTSAGLAKSLGFTALSINVNSNDDNAAIQTKLRRAIRGVNFNVDTRGLVPGDMKPINTTTVGNPTQGPDRHVEVDGYIDSNKAKFQVGTLFNANATFNARALAGAINDNADSKFWAMMDQNDETKLYVFNKEGGEHNDLLACDVYGIDAVSLEAREKYISFENLETGLTMTGGTNFSLGTNAANNWAQMKPMQTKQVGGNQVWNVTLNGSNVGKDRDLWIAANGELDLPEIDQTLINGLDRFGFTEVQNASDAPWAGAHVRTQEAAQESLDAINNAINSKDKVRATLGAYQNRLENTISNLEIQAENLLASESRISDVDVAKEVTELTKNSVLVQAAMGMLSQANSLNNLALSLIR